MSESAEVTQLPLKSKGPRPYFFDDPAVDKLLAMLLSVVEELSVEREKRDSLVRLLEEKGVLSAAELAAYMPDSQGLQEREDQRQSLLNAVFRIVLQEAEDLQRPA